MFDKEQHVSTGNNLCDVTMVSVQSLRCGGTTEREEEEEEGKFCVFVRLQSKNSRWNIIMGGRVGP